MFCEEKKSKCPKKNFQSVKRGEEYLSMEFRVFEKNEVRQKCSEKRFLGGNFAKFVFTGWVLYWFARKEKKCVWAMGVALVGCHVVKHG